MFVLLSLALSSNGMSQSTIQYRLDTISSASLDILEQVTATPDGSHWAILSTTNGKVLWKADGNGSPLWSMLLGPDDQNATITALPNNTCLLASVLPGEYLNQQADEDTLRFHITFTAIAPDGSLAWKRAVTSDVLYPGDFGLATVNPIICKPGIEGDLFALINVLLGNNGLNGLTSLVLKFSGSGDLLWGSTFGQWLWNFIWAGGVKDIEPSSDGGGYLFSERDLNKSGARLLRFSPNGDMIWFKRIAYTNSGLWSINDMMVDALDRPVLAGNSQVDPTYGMAVCLHPSGTLSSAHFYQGVPGYQGFTRAERLAGENLFLSGINTFISTDTNGIVTNALVIQDTSIAPLDYHFGPKGPAITGDRIVLPGHLGSVHQIFGYYLRYPQIWSFQMDQDEGCLLHPFTVTDIDVPDSLISITQDTSYHSLSHFAQAVPMPFSGTFTTPLATLPACSLLVGVEEHGTDPVGGLHILGNPLLSDGLVHVVCDQDADLSIFKADGSLVCGSVRLNRHIVTSIPMKNYAPGLYSAVAVFRDFPGATTEKLMIAP